MKSITYLVLLFFCTKLTAFSQCSFEVKINPIHPKCEPNSGIIHVQTNAVSPTFTWSNGLTDSIGTNLPTGLYSIKVRDINGCETTTETYLANYTADARFSSPNAAFTYLVEKNGYVRFANAKTGMHGKWTFGDGGTETGFSPVHKYATAGTYQVCHEYTNICGSDTVCTNVPVSIKQKQLEIGNSAIKISDLNLPEQFNVYHFCECNSKLFFAGSGTTQDTQNVMYSFDLSTKSLVKIPVTVKRYQLTNSNRYGKGFICKDNLLYFSGNNNISGRELYQSNGTVAGTRLVSDFSVGKYHSDPDEFFIYNNNLYYQGWKSEEGYSEGGTYLYNGSSVSKVMYGFMWEPQAVNNKIVYNTSDGNLYSASTVGGTATLLKDFSSLQNMGKVNGQMLFYSYDAVHGNELWKTDGTLAGTNLVKDINSGTNSSKVYGIGTYYNGYVYFLADDGINGIELWKSDGTEVGTTLVKDINPGQASSNPGDLIVSDNLLFFSAETATYGRELWKSDGTSNGTLMLFDGALGSQSHINTYSTTGTEFISDGGSVYYLSHVGLAKAGKTSTAHTNIVSWGYGCYGSTGKLFKMPNGKIHFYSMLGVSRLCEYKKAYVNDSLLVMPSDDNTLTPIILKANGQSGFTYEWFVNEEPRFCSYNVKSNNQTYSFNSRLSARIPDVYVRSFTSEGCPSPVDKVNFLVRNEPSIEVFGTQRCSKNKVMIYARIPNGKFYTGNTFTAHLVNSSGEQGTLPVQFDGEKAFTFTLPDGIPEVFEPDGSGFAIILRSTKPNAELTWVPVGNVTEMKLSIYRDKIINEGQSFNLFVSTGENLPLPYSFKVDGKNYQNLLADPFKIETSKTSSKNYVISDFKNACSTGQIGLNSATLKVNKPCVSTINHSNIINDNNYFAQNQIESQGKVSNNGIVEYNSGKSLNLTPGFSVEKGGYFKGVIDGCN